jgi:hypothetical protein
MDWKPSPPHHQMLEKGKPNEDRVSFFKKITGREHNQTEYRSAGAENLLAWGWKTVYTM